MIKDSRHMSSNELRAFLGSSQFLTFSAQSRTQTYAWIERTLRQYGYLARSRAEKGLLRQYLLKMTGLSRAQMARLIAQFRRTGQVRLRPYQSDALGEVEELTRGGTLPAAWSDLGRLGADSASPQ